MHVLAQMVEVMLRTARWSLEILVIICLMCRSKSHFLRWQSGKFTNTLKLFTDCFLWFKWSLWFINTLSNRKMDAVAANVGERAQVGQLSASLCYRPLWQQSAGRRSPAVCPAGASELADGLQWFTLSCLRSCLQRKCMESVDTCNHFKSFSYTKLHACFCLL